MLEKPGGGVGLRTEITFYAIKLLKGRSHTFDHMCWNAFPRPGSHIPDGILRI